MEFYYAPRIVSKQRKETEEKIGFVIDIGTIDENYEKENEGKKIYRLVFLDRENDKGFVYSKDITCTEKAFFKNEKDAKDTIRLLNQEVFAKIYSRYLTVEELRAGLSKEREQKLLEAEKKLNKILDNAQQIVKNFWEKELNC